MLRKETITPEVESVMNKLMQIDSLHKFRLVGGTALALQIGHRKSIDIDLFSENRNTYDKIFNDLKSSFHTAINSFRYAKQGISLTISGVKVDLFDWDHFLRPAIIEEGWRLAHKDDIVPMKIDTFIDSVDLPARFEKKDFIDLSCLMKEYSMEKMIDLYFNKYPENLLNDRIILERCGRFDRAENTLMPVMLNGQTWEDTKEVINNAIDVYMKNQGINIVDGHFH
jgi:hypothetical protein